MNSLFDEIFGKDYLEYDYIPLKGTNVSDQWIPMFTYNHDLWEKQYLSKFEEASDTVKVSSSSNRTQDCQKVLKLDVEQEDDKTFRKQENPSKN